MSLTGKDLIRDYGNKEERLNSNLLKQSGGFLSGRSWGGSRVLGTCWLQ